MMTPVAPSHLTQAQHLNGVNAVMGVACVTSRNSVMTSRLQSAFYSRDVGENCYNTEIIPLGVASCHSAAGPNNRRPPNDVTDPVASIQRQNGRRTTLVDITVVSLDSSSLPGYMRPTVVSYQKTLVNRQHPFIKSSSSRDSRRPHSSVVTSNSFPANMTATVPAWPVTPRHQAVTNPPLPRRYTDDYRASDPPHLTPAPSRVLPALPGQPSDNTAVELHVGLSGNMRPESGHSYRYSDSNESNNTSRKHALHRPKRVAVVEIMPGDVTQSRQSPGSNVSSHYSQHSNGRVPPVSTLISETTKLDNPVSNGNQPSRRTVGWSREATTISHAQQHPVRVDALGAVATLYRTRSIGTLPQRFTDVPPRSSQRPSAMPTGPVRHPLAARNQQAINAKRPATTSITKLTSTTKSAMVKSKSQPSFRTLLEPWSRDREAARNIVTKDNENRLKNVKIDGVEVVEEEAGDADDDDDQLTDDEDEEEALTRNRIEEWLEQMEGLVFEAPPTPDIDDDSPLQTDTAIHIVYEGDEQ